MGEQADVVELVLGRWVLRLDRTVIEVFHRPHAEPLRIHVNHAGAEIVPKRNGAVEVRIGWPKRWMYGLPGGADERLICEGVQRDPRATFELDASLEPAVRELLAEAARRRTLPLRGSPPDP